MLGKSLQGSKSSANNRMFVYEVEGLRQNDQTDDNNYQIRSSSTLIQVPYSRMNEEMQRISRLGGKVVSVRPLNGNGSATQGGTRKKALRPEGQLYRIRYTQAANGSSPQIRRSASECVVSYPQLSSTLKRLNQRGCRVADVSPA